METKLYNGDCLEVIKQIPDGSVDCIITDPPYLISPHGGGKGGLADRSSRIRDEIEFIANDFDFDACFKEMIRVCKKVNIILFCSNKQLGRTIVYFENLGYKVDTLVWSKTNPSPLCFNKYISDIEYIVYVHEQGSCFNNDVKLDYKKKVKRYPIITNKMNKVHPTQKPEMLIQEFVYLHTKENDIVLDPFMGSGTTGVVCKQNNRNFIGIELDEKYFRIAEDRINGVLL